MRALTREFHANGGDLTPETKERLRKNGYPDALIETSLNGLRADQREQERQAVALLGSEEALQKVLDFASTLPEEEKEAYNAALVGPAWKATLKGLAALANVAGPAATSTLNSSADSNEPTPTPGVVSNGKVTPVGFKDVHALTKAINDPRYRTNQDGHRDRTEKQCREFYGRAS